MVDSGLSGRLVVVFGAAGALGSGIAAAFADAGAAVVGADRVLPAAEHQLSGVSYESIDVLDDGAVAALFDSRPAPWAVINTVGGFAPKRPLAELDPAELTSQLSLNLVSAAL
ncbi:MAG: NAD-dependent epimerase/dehydratase family protein, partial [Actinobacteria bacterium]|nr:NAD-dependent epimerase/dehydratase family protein [Actinomycetota bacterium]